MSDSKKQTQEVTQSNTKPAKLTGLTVRSALKGGLATPGCNPCHRPSAL
jgi:hypothetical protein